MRTPAFMSRRKKKSYSNCITKAQKTVQTRSRHRGIVARLALVLVFVIVGGLSPGHLSAGKASKMEAAMTAHRAALDARRRSTVPHLHSQEAVEKPRDRDVRDGGGRKRGIRSPRGFALGGAPFSRPGSAARRGTHTRFGDGEAAGASPKRCASHSEIKSQWEDYQFKPVVPMHLRRWTARSATRPPAHSASIPVLTFVSYNILAESLESNTTAGLDRGIASFEARRKLLANELQSWNADVYCLQEVDHFDDFLAPLMDDLGLSGEFLQRRGDRQDGCAVFWRREKLRIISSSPLHFDVSHQFDRPNVAQVLEFEAIDVETGRQQASNAEGRTEANAGKRFLVANTHILFNPKRGDIKLQQVQMTLAHLWDASDGGTKPIIYCGDFNSAPFSPLYEYLSTGMLVLDGLCPSLVSGQVAWDAALAARSAPILREARGGSGAALSVKALGRSRGRGLVCRYFAQGWCRDSAACPYLHVPAALGGRDSHLPRGKSAHECRTIWSSWISQMQSLQEVRRAGEGGSEQAQGGAAGGDCLGPDGGAMGARVEKREGLASRDVGNGQDGQSWGMFDIPPTYTANSCSVEECAEEEEDASAVGRLRKKCKETHIRTDGLEDSGKGKLGAGGTGRKKETMEDTTERRGSEAQTAASARRDGRRGPEDRPALLHRASLALQHGLHLSSVYSQPMQGPLQGAGGGLRGKCGELPSCVPSGLLGYLHADARLPVILHVGWRTWAHMCVACCSMPAACSRVFKSRRRKAGSQRG